MIFLIKMRKGLSKKDVHNPERGCQMRTRGSEFFKFGLCTFWCKNFGFIEIYGVSAQTGGVEPVRTFSWQWRGGQFFAILCERLLWMAHQLHIIRYIPAFLNINLAY